MRYDVHILAVHRDKFCGIEAASQAEAIAKAQEMFDMDGAARPLPGLTVEHCGFNEEIFGYLVDEQGDGEYRNSRFYEADGETLAIDDRMKFAATELLAALKAALQSLAADAEHYEDTADEESRMAPAIYEEARAAIAKAETV